MKKLKNDSKTKIYVDETNGDHVMEVADIKKADAGTYTVSASNKHGTEMCPVTLMVTDKEEEANEWKEQLRKAVVEVREVEENQVDWGQLKKVEANQPQDAPQPDEAVAKVAEEAQPIPEVKFEKVAKDQAEQKKETPEKPNKGEKTKLETKDKEKPLEEQKAPEESVDKGAWERKKTEKEEEEAEDKKLQIEKTDLKFVRTLQDVEGREKDSVTFVCELNKANRPVQWLFQGMVVQPGVRFHVVDEGTVKKLTVEGLTMEEDEAEVVVQATGQLKSAAKLKIRGKSCFSNATCLALSC